MIPVRRTGREVGASLIERPVDSDGIVYDDNGARRNELAAEGIKVIVQTGDDRKTAITVAKRLGITGVDDRSRAWNSAC